MVKSYDSIMYNLSSLSEEYNKVSAQISGTSKLTSGSDDSLEYDYILSLQNDYNYYSSIGTNISLASSYNSTSDTAISSSKTAIESLISELMEINNDTNSDDSVRSTYISTLTKAKENLLNLANTQVDGKYIFSGQNTDVQPFLEDSSTGVVSFQSDTSTRSIKVDKGTYTDVGVNGLDVFYYKNQDVAAGDSFTFAENEVVLNEDGEQWKLLDTDNDGTYDGLYLNGDSSTTPIAITDNGDGTYTATNSTSTAFEVRHSLFDDLDTAIAALNNQDTDGNAITDDQRKTILSDIQDKMKNDIYDTVNDAHTDVGSKTSTLETYGDIITSKKTNLNVLLTEHSGLTSEDLTELGTKLTSIQGTMESVYAVIAKMSKLSLTNYL